MKKYIKKWNVLMLVGLILSGILLANKMTVNATQQIECYGEYVTNLIPAEAKRVAENNYQDMINIVLQKKGYFDIKGSDLINVTLGKPFLIFEEELGQDEIYYFPLVKDNKVIMVMGVCGVNGAWNVSLSKEYVDLLNEIEYIENGYTFVKKGDVLFAENEQKCLRIYDRNAEFQVVLTPSLGVWAERQKEYVEKVASLKKTDAKQINKTARCAIGLEGYTPSFGTSTSTAKVMALYNQQGQGTDKLCWAASVATIVNYIYGTNYTARNVADAQGISYSTGTDIYTKQKALDYYSVNYDYIILSQLSYEKIKNNVNNKRPVAISAFSSLGDGHAVTLYGYGANYVYLWNSGINGTGASQLVKYSSSGTTFPYNNTSFTWTYTLYASE